MGQGAPWGSKSKSVGRTGEKLKPARKLLDKLVARLWFRMRTTRHTSGLLLTNKLDLDPLPDVGDDTLQGFPEELLAPQHRDIHRC